MTDIDPPWRFSAHCPQCNATLSIKHEGIELKGDERLICPVHGDVMSLEEARRIVFESNRDDIIDKARQIARGLFKK